MSNRITRAIFSSTDFRSKFVTSHGSRFHVRYEPRFNGEVVVLREVGREDIQERIEAYAPYTDLNYMLSRLKVGDTNVLNSRQPLYGDFTGLPSNGIDAVNLVQNAESRFNVLPQETRQKYNNDFRVWLASLLHTASSIPNHKVDTSVGSSDDVQKSVTDKE